MTRKLSRGVAALVLALVLAAAAAGPVAAARSDGGFWPEASWGEL